MDQNIENSDHEQPPVTAVIGTVIMFAGAVLLFAMMTLVDNLGGVEKPSRDITLPAMFYVDRPMWYALAGFLIATGVVMQRSTPTATQCPVFRSVVIFTRKDCHLCDDAKIVLLKWSADLPTILDVDIDDDPELVEQFGECVPVIEIDGKVRFRGNVSEVMFRRLIDAAKRRRADSDGSQPSVEPADAHVDVPANAGVDASADAAAHTSAESSANTDTLESPAQNSSSSDEESSI